MAYIPKDEEEQQGGMNVLAPQNQQQTTQQDAQNQPQNVSGGQSATIGGGQAQQGSQGQSQAPKSKQAKSGMFTNIRKYMERNKPGAQAMSGKLQQNVSQQNQNIQQAIGKQKTDFMSRVQSNRERLQGAQQFGQQTLQSAQAQESMPMLQQQQQDLQQRVGQFGNVADQTQNINQYTGQISDQQTAYNNAQKAYDQAQQQFQQYSNQFSSVLPEDFQIKSGEETRSYGGHLNKLAKYDTYYTQDQLNKQLLAGNQGIISQVDQALQNDRDLVSGIESNPNLIFSTQDQYDQYTQAKQRLESFQQYRDNLSAQQAAQDYQTSQLGQLESYQEQLARAQEQQRLFQNKQTLQGELSQLEERIQNAPESLSEDDIARFNQLRTGVERFDDAILNLSQQKRDVQNLSQLTESLETNQGRRNLMRQEFGRQGGYTSGQASLDNLIITGNPTAMRELVANSQAQAKQAQDTLQQAFQEGRITQDEMARGTRNIQRDLQQGVTEAQNTLMRGSVEFRDLASQRAEQESILNDQYASQEQITNAQAALNNINERINSFEGQIGLTERARRGEGTYISELKKKLASGQGISEEDLNILGMTGQERYNVDPTQLLQNIQIDPEQFGIQDVANLTDVARADALARLSGEAAGENRFVNEQMGIDLAERKGIENRNLASPEEKFTTTYNELSENDRQSVNQFLSDLGSAKYSSPQEARQDVMNTTANKHSLTHMANSIQTLSEGGSINIYGKEITPEDILSQQPWALGYIRDANAWATKGATGFTGNWVHPDSIVNAVREGTAKMSALQSAYQANGNALKSETDSSFDQQDIANKYNRR